MATWFNNLGIEPTKQKSAEALSKMPIMEQLVVANRIQNQQRLRMLGLNDGAKSRHVTPKQQNTKENKSKKKTMKDVDWTPDMAVEETMLDYVQESDNAEMLVGTKSCATTRKSNNSFPPPTEPGIANNDSLNPALPTSLPATSQSAKRRLRKKAAQTVSETDKPASPSNIYNNPSSYQNQSAQKKDTSVLASRKTPKAATPPPAWLQPFTGFTAEQIETARQRSIEAQNRKEAIVRLMRAKIFNKDDLATIEPADLTVLQAVLKRHKQEAKEQHKAEQRRKFAVRYPRRNVSRKNYHESTEDDDILDQDATYTFHCDKCKKDYEGHRICPLHYDTSGHLDKAELDNRSQGYIAMKSLPEGMLVKVSPIPGAGRGVFTGQFTTLSKDMIYGPYEGVRIYNESEAHQSGYCWQIYYKRKISRWIDARQVRRSNWLRYINCAATTEQQNVCAYQVGQNIYYRTVVGIGPGTELLVWYGDDYARELGLLSMAFMASLNSIAINDVDLACWGCQLEFRCRQLLNQHKFTTHESVNSNIVDVVGRTRCVTNTGGTRHALGSVAKPDALVHKPRIAGSTDSAISGVVASPGSTVSGARSYIPHACSVGTNEGFDIADACKTDSVVGKCQVTASSGGAGVSLSGVQLSVDSSRVVVTDYGRRLQCSTCCKLFTRRTELVTHTRIHTGEKPFECTTCGERFTQNVHLTTHSRLHTGEKPFKCATCDQRFADNGNLTRHTRIHTGVKPFKCTTCGQRFTQSSTLTRHSRIHTGEKSFVCTSCGRMFTHGNSLTTHSRIHWKKFEQV